MNKMSKRMTNAAEVIEFGRNLNNLYDLDKTFEMEDNTRCLKDCLLEDVISSFQKFYNGETNKFKVRIIQVDCKMMSARQIEFERLQK